MYKGHKNIDGVREKILNTIPICYRFIELFAGSGYISSIVSGTGARTVLVEKSTLQCSFLRTKFPGAVIENVCALEWLRVNQKYLSKNDVIFVDPPYLHHTRPNSVNLYDHETDDFFHLELVQLLKSTPANIVVIHPFSLLYEKAFSDWIKKDVYIRYNTKTSHEVIYSNIFDLEELQYPFFYGDNRTVRQQYKRIVVNTQKKINSMNINLRKRLYL